MDIYLEVEGAARTLSLRASNDTTSLNFARDKTASWIRTTPSSVSEKLSVCIFFNQWLLLSTNLKYQVPTTRWRDSRDALGFASPRFKFYSNLITEAR